MADYTTTALLTRCRLWSASAAGSPPSVSDVQLLDIMNEELRSVITPLLLSLNQDYLVDWTDTAIDPTVEEYRLPSRALFGKLREIKMVDPGSTTLTNVALINYESLDNMRDRVGCYFKGNTLILINPNIYGANKSLRMYYYQRPSDLVATSACAKITVINTLTSTVTVASVPTAWGASATVDCVQAVPPFGILGTDLTGTITGTDIVLSSIPDTLAVGDYVALAGETPIPNVPLELHNLLCQGAAIKMLEICADAQGLQMASVKYQQMERAVMKLGRNRITGEPRVVVPRNVFT